MGTSASDPSQSSSLEAHAGSYASSVGDGKKQEPTHFQSLYKQASSHNVTREELTIGFVKGIQDEIRKKKEAHTKKPQYTVLAYKFSAEQKVKEAIGNHTELIPPPGTAMAQLYPDMPLADEDVGAPESAQ